MKKGKLLFRIIGLTIAVFMVTAYGCTKEDQIEFDDVVWTEVNQGGFKYLGIAKSGESMAIKLHDQSEMPKQIVYKNKKDPEVIVWVSKDGLPEMLYTDGAYMLFENIRPDLIDVAVVVDGHPVEIVRDIELTESFGNSGLKSSTMVSGAGETISYAGIILDGVLCIASVGSVKFTGPVGIKFAKLTCGSAIASITKKGVEKLVDDEGFSAAMTFYDTHDTFTSIANPSPGSVLGLIGGWVSIVENDKEENKQIIQNANLLLMFSGSAKGADGFTYRLSLNRYSEKVDLTARAKQEFGSTAEVADWNDIKTNFGNNVGAFLTLIGMPPGFEESIMVKRNGQFFYGTARQYFVNRFDGKVPGYYLVHDQIGNNTLVIGSWYDLNHRMLIKHR
jgi:hypothetical protein